ncbi:hypothetical protein BGZ65_005217 [Modicella reniformis]|uniref:ADF-H domain-containing protein n=1 Tax=Modicella reniformis TaxID=1440133 RepID=A0A9P6LYT9_9FUNG|nr:hypothetical protein BGZ65_005217 [Modicella reniformis]
MVPDSAPRYIILSIKLDHNDGRVSYPMVFLYYAPKSVRPELNMLYAGTKAHFNRTTKAVKALDVEDDEVLNVEWLRNSLLK